MRKSVRRYGRDAYERHAGGLRVEVRRHGDLYRPSGTQPAVRRDAPARAQTAAEPSPPHRRARERRLRRTDRRGGGARQARGPARGQARARARRGGERAGRGGRAPAQEGEPRPRPPGRPAVLRARRLRRGLLQAAGPHRLPCAARGGARQGPLRARPRHARARLRDGEPRRLDRSAVPGPPDPGAARPTSPARYSSIPDTRSIRTAFSCAGPFFCGHSSRTDGVVFSPTTFGTGSFFTQGRSPVEGFVGDGFVSTHPAWTR